MERKAVSQSSSRPFSVPQLSIKWARPTQIYLQSVGKYPERLSPCILSRLDPSLQLIRIGARLVAETITATERMQPRVHEWDLEGVVRDQAVQGMFWESPLFRTVVIFLPKVCRQ